MGTDPVKWLFDPGNILASPEAIKFFGSWEEIYKLVEKWHVLGKFGITSQFQEQKNLELIKKIEQGKKIGYKNLIISIYLVRDWKILVYTRPIAEITSVIFELEKRRWRVNC